MYYYYTIDGWRPDWDANDFKLTGRRLREHLALNIQCSQVHDKEVDGDGGLWVDEVEASKKKSTKDSESTQVRPVRRLLRDM